MRKCLILGLLVVGCSEESSCFDTLSCPPADTTTGGRAGSGGESSGGTAGTGNSGSGGTAGKTSTTGVSGSSGGGSGGAGGATSGTGGTGGGSGAGGAPEACDGACGGSTPVCDEAADTCVGCLDSTEHCEAPTPACDPDSHECVECVETPDCDAGVCDTEAQHCVDCLQSEDCEAPTPLCDTEAQLCVECLGNVDCENPLEAYCDAGSCSPCQSNADCAHLTGTTVCDTGAGECVECTGTDYTSCGLNDDDEQLVCDSLSRTCTDQVEHGSFTCQPCVADAQCPLGQACVLQVFDGQDVGYFCLWKEGATENGAPADCFVDGQPYAGRLVDTESIDGQVSTVCGLRKSTCPAKNQFGEKNCAPEGTPDDSLCGVDPTNDAKCVQASPTAYRCTMRCIISIDCPDTLCNTGPLEPVCELAP